MSHSDERVALFPGSFDPFTLGHYDLVMRATSIFDRIIIAVGYNVEKKSFLTLENRQRLIEDCFVDFPNIEVVCYSGLTIELCRETGISTILRGVRSITDFEFEKSINDVNHMLEPRIETLLMITTPHSAMISSSVVRELYVHRTSTAAMMPEGIVLSNYVSR